MTIKAVAPWFGGKRNMAPLIVELLGKHRVYWEPFCGSMAVLMVKPPCVMETVNDLHMGLINLARVIQDPVLGPQLYRRLRRTLMAEQLHQEAAHRYRNRGLRAANGVPNINKAYDYFLCAWLGRNGLAGSRSYNQGFCVRYTSNGGHAAKRWQSAIESIPSWRRRLANVTILHRDGFELLQRIEDKQGTAIYVDPPYLEKGTKYLHDFEHHDHERLAALLNKFTKTRIVLSYYDNPRLEYLYPHWFRYEITVTKSLANQNRHSKKSHPAKAIEVLLSNLDLCGRPLPKRW